MIACGFAPDRERSLMTTSSKSGAKPQATVRVIF
jgi:hypothetical protein